MKRYAIRSQAVAHAIARMEEFNTHGNMDARTFNQGSAGYLRGDGLEAYYRDVNTLDYIVYSYYTPIAWHTPENGWVVVDKSFSISSGKHQSAARWGVSMSDDKRVQHVMPHYSLSEAQRGMLWEAISENKLATERPDISGYFTVGGQARRTANKLQELGLLAQDGFNPGEYRATDAAMNYARS